MNALLRAYAQAWSQAGVPKLAALIGTIEAPDGLLSPEDQVPASLKQDYDQAVEALTVFPKLKQQLSRIGDRLPWMQGAMRMPASFQGRFAYVELAGPTGMIAISDIRFGLYLQQHDTVYPSHWHEAVEDYLIASGTALWQVDDAGFNAQPPGTHIKHASNQPHATTTLQDPLLAMWFWQGDIRNSTYRVVGVDA
ncbi:dimethylsulfonioproprionate lyase family protein [Anderseniella sp. Alg231-50]|uniref:dimethylsulfonioproprionate lyase family protein n=1 Tax=Anderseniella sp. Alg231-50 TaxID=1922226 RepID=UPI000D54B599